MPHEPFIPTRTQPHRFCEPLHRICGISFWVAAASMLFTGLGGILVFIVAVIAGFVTMRVMHGGKTAREIVTEEIEEDEAAIKAYHEARAQAGEQSAVRVFVPGQRFVRPAWAWVAAGCDTFMALCCFSLPVLILFGPSGSRPLLSTDFLPIFAGMALLAFDQLAHHLGTTPNPPKTTQVYDDAIKEG